MRIDKKYKGYLYFFTVVPIQYTSYHQSKLKIIILLIVYNKSTAVIAV